MSYLSSGEAAAEISLFAVCLGPSNDCPLLLSFQAESGSLAFHSAVILKLTSGRIT